MLVALVEKFKNYIKRNKENQDYELKRKMCRSAIREGICPNFCHHCAWNTGMFKND